MYSLTTDMSPPGYIKYLSLTPHVERLQCLHVGGQEHHRAGQTLPVVDTGVLWCWYWESCISIQVYFGVDTERAAFPYRCTLVLILRELHFHTGVLWCWYWESCISIQVYFGVDTERAAFPYRCTLVLILRELHFHTLCREFITEQASPILHSVDNGYAHLVCLPCRFFPAMSAAVHSPISDDRGNMP